MMGVSGHGNVVDLFALFFCCVLDCNACMRTNVRAYNRSPLPTYILSAKSTYGRTDNRNHLGCSIGNLTLLGSRGFV